MVCFADTLSHTYTFTHKRFYTQSLLQTLLHRHFYTQTRCTQTSSYAHNTFTHRHSYTQTLLHAQHFYTQTLLHAFYTQEFLHIDTFTHRDFLTHRRHDTHTFTHGGNRGYWHCRPKVIIVNWEKVTIDVPWLMARPRYTTVEVCIL